MQYTSRYKSMSEAVLDIQTTAKILNDFSKRLSKVKRERVVFAIEKDFTNKLNSSISVITKNSNSLKKIAGCLDNTISAYIIAEQNSLNAIYSASIANAVNKNVIGLFGGFNFSLKYINDISGLNVFLFGIRNYKEVVEAIIRGKVTSTSIADAFMNDPDKVRALLRGVVNRLNDTEDMKVLTKSQEHYLDLLVKTTGFEHNEDVHKYLKTVFKTVEATDKVITDYGKHIDMLESLRSISPSNKCLNGVVDDLISEYNNQFISVVIDEAKKTGVKSIVSITGFKPADTIIKYTLGDNKTLNGMETVIGLSSLKASSMQALNQSAEVIMSGNYTQSDVNNYINAFNLTRELTVEEYTAMLTNYKPNSSEAIYLNNQIEVLKNMTADNYSAASSFSNGAGRGF